MGEKIAFENGRISDFQGLVTLTLTLNRVILHIPSFICRRPLPTYQISLKSKKHFVDGRTYRTDGRTFETGFIRSTCYSSVIRKPISMKFHRYIVYTRDQCLYKANGVDFRFDVITSFYDVIPPRHTRLELVLYWALLLPSANICPMVWYLKLYKSSQCMLLSGLTSFHWTAKISPRMNPNSCFWAQKSKKNSTPYPPRRLRLLDARAYGARNSRLRRSSPPGFSCFTPGSWGASWNTGLITSA